MNRKTVGIEDLLGWAYRQELPKVKAEAANRFAGLTPLAKWTDLATLVDTSPNGFGCIPDFSETGEPDPDAITIGRAVADLDAVDFSGEVIGVDMLRDVAEATISGEERVKAHEDGARQAYSDDDEPRRRASITVAMAAMLGRRPHAEPVGTIKRSFVTLGGKPRWFRMEWREGTGGRRVPIEVDGYNRKSGRPHKDAYRKVLLSPDLGPIVADRIDYRIWRMSLDHLVSVLDGALTSFRVLPSPAPQWPWEGNERSVPLRVWPMLATPEREDA